MGHSNYELTPEQKKQLDKFAEDIIDEIESRLSNDIGGILDPYYTPNGLVNYRLTKDQSAFSSDLM